MVWRAAKTPCTGWPPPCLNRIRPPPHEASLKADIDPDDLSFTHSLRVIRRTLPLVASVPPEQMEQRRTQVLDRILEERAVSSRGASTIRAIKRYKPRFPRKKKFWPTKAYQPVIVILTRTG